MKSDELLYLLKLAAAHGVLDEFMYAYVMTGIMNIAVVYDLKNLKNDTKRI